MSFLEKVKGISSAPHNRFTVIMGKPGSSKTTIAGTFPKPILYVSIASDGGGEVLQNYGDDSVKFIAVEDEPLTKQGGKNIHTQLMELLSELKNTKHPYKTVVFDTYSSIEENLVKRMETIKGSKLNMPERGIIGGLMLNLRDMIVELSQGDVEYVVVSHVKTDESNIDASTGEVNPQIIPKMSKNNGRILMEKASNVMYCCKRAVSEDGKTSVKFLAYLGAHPNIDTKLRLANRQLDETGIYIENCTYDKIEELRTGKKSVEDLKTKNVIEIAKNPFGVEEGEINNE